MTSIKNLALVLLCSSSLLVLVPGCGGVGACGQCIAEEQPPRHLIVRCETPHGSWVENDPAGVARYHCTSDDPYHVSVIEPVATCPESIEPPEPGGYGPDALPMPTSAEAARPHYNEV